MKDTKVFNLMVDNTLKGFLQDALRKIMSVVSAECGSLFLFDQKHKELVLDTFCNTYELQIEGLRKRLGDGVSGKVAELKAPVLVNNIDKDLRFHKNGFTHYHTNSFMSIPLFGSQGLIGLINIADKSTGEPFCAKDLEFAVALSQYACVIVEHFMDSSLLKEEREALKHQKSLLEKYASVGKLAAGVVHEVNNPLDGIIRYTNMLIDLQDNNSIGREYLIEMKKGLNRIANITKTLLEFAHQVNSNSSQVKKYIDVHKLIDESLDMLKGKISTGVQIHRNYQESLPCVLDLGLQHIVINIIKNALDAMPAGGKLEICTSLDNQGLKVEFKDTGFGMPKEIMENIFQPFYTTKTKEKGTGLGLAICKEIINKYEGDIKVESYPEKGSYFTILIPQKQLKNG